MGVGVGPALQGDLRYSVQSRGREEEEWQKAIRRRSHPKEEQHASPGGHLFSQVCSPNVIKIGAAHPLPAMLPWYTKTVCRGMGVRRVEQLCCFGADGTDDERLT